MLTSEAGVGLLPRRSLTHGFHILPPFSDTDFPLLSESHSDLSLQVAVAQVKSRSEFP